MGEKETGYRGERKESGQEEGEMRLDWRKVPPAPPPPIRIETTLYGTRKVLLYMYM